MSGNSVAAGSVRFGNGLPFVLIDGPCQMEGRDHAIRMAEELARLAGRLDIPFVFKTSFDKANRTSLNGARGVGLEAALPVFEEIREKIGCPLVTDIHLPEQCAPVAEYVDILQIPAFLCRQTDLLLAAGATGQVVNVKKGQFMAPGGMKKVAEKIESTGNRNILLTERGASFGYNTLVTDFRALPVMATAGYPVVFDATHSVQIPGGLGDATGGQREFVAPLARAAVAVGTAAVFIETHDDPERAPSDGPNMIPLARMEPLLRELKRFDELRKEITENSGDKT